MSTEQRIFNYSTAKVLLAKRGTKVALEVKADSESIFADKKDFLYVITQREKNGCTSFTDYDGTECPVYYNEKEKVLYIPAGIL